MNTKGFDKAFEHSMLYEIGPWFDPTDPETISGACATPAQQRKVGYCNVPGDSGGLTKYGVAQNYNKNVDVQKLDLAGAKKVYLDSYWVLSRCNSIEIPIHLFYFDMVINMGLSRAAKILQEAVGVTADGIIGNITLAAVNSVSDVASLIEKMNDIRVARYHAIVKAKASQQKFLKGWLRRTNEVRTAALQYV